MNKTKKEVHNKELFIEKLKNHLKLLERLNEAQDVQIKMLEKLNDTHEMMIGCHKSFDNDIKNNFFDLKEKEVTKS